uniref:Uncharacterized protein n=1 Tax=uncultured Thiotrichaceae bacterium TaxID=298394 RepID=A0A6S6SRG7_9GAMM|nr:MAG: Unknown protein [uncultured Thiotrichaceae bacterium]
MNEALTRISKEASLLSNYAWFATVATDPQAKQDSIDNVISQWEYLQAAFDELKQEVQK